MGIRHIFIWVGVMAFYAANAYGQFKLEVQSFGELPTDITARTNGRTDYNGDPTAVLKIPVPAIQAAEISSPLKVGNQVVNSGVLVIYLGDGSKKIKILHPEFEALDYEFPTPLDAKKSYQLVLRLPTEYFERGTASVKFITNVHKGTLTINDKEINFSDGCCIVNLKKGDYSYSITPEVPGYEKIEGNVSITEDVLRDGRIDLYATLPTVKKSSLKIDTYPGSNISINGSPVSQGKNKNLIVSLPVGRHIVEINLNGHEKTFEVDLANENEYLNADIRIPISIDYPSMADFSLVPVGDKTLKPSTSKFKAGETVRVLGDYILQIKGKNYEPAEYRITVTPENQTGFNKSLLVVSKAKNLYTGSGGVKQNKNKAESLFDKMIQSGDEVAMYEYGLLLQYEKPSKAIELIKRSAKKGYPLASLWLAKPSNITLSSNEQREQYLLNALKYGYNEAHVELGKLYSSPGYFNFNKAIDQFEQYNSPESRILRAEIVLSNSELYNGDFSQIYSLLETVPVNDPHFSKAQVLMGEMAYRGIGTPKDLNTAIQYWKSVSPNKLSQQALWVLAIENMTDPTSLSKYLPFIDLKALNKDKILHKQVSAMAFLTSAAHILMTSKRSKEAFDLYKRAYDLGDGSLPTLRVLGGLYKDGKVTEKNLYEAKRLLEEAATQYNDVASYRLLGAIAEEENQNDKAETYYRKAISLGDNNSKGYLGTLMYKKGKRFYPAAVELWTEAANGGHQNSIKHLFEFYTKVEKNPELASYWNSKLKLN